MKITFTKPATNARGVFQPGDRVDWPAEDAQSVVDAGLAIEGWPKKTAPAPLPRRTPNVTGRAVEDHNG